MQLFSRTSHIAPICRNFTRFIISLVSHISLARILMGVLRAQSDSPKRYSSIFFRSFHAIHQFHSFRHLQHATVFTHLICSKEERLFSSSESSNRVAQELELHHLHILPTSTTFTNFANYPFSRIPFARKTNCLFLQLHWPQLLRHFTIFTHFTCSGRKGSSSISESNGITQEIEVHNFIHFTHFTNAPNFTISHISPIALISRKERTRKKRTRALKFRDQPLGWPRR